MVLSTYYCRFAIGLIASVALLLAYAGSANATLIQTWDLSNKTPGALGPNYGLRINNLQNQFTELPSSGFGGTSGIMIFDFEHPGFSTVRLRQYESGGDTSLELRGSAFGAVYDSNVAGGYSNLYAGTYDLQFTWLSVGANLNGYDFLAENGIASYQQGGGTGTVVGRDVGTAFVSDALRLHDWSGKHNRTLEIRASGTPDASGWLSFGNGTHNGDYGFNMTQVSVPIPGTLALFALGFFGLGWSRHKQNP